MVNSGSQRSSYEDAQATPLDLRKVVAELRLSREVTHKIRHRGQVREMPSRERLEGVVAGLIASLFPSHFGRQDLTDDNIDYFVGDTLGSALSELTEQVRRGLRFDHEDNLPDAHSLESRARQIVAQFAAQLPEIRSILVSDLVAAYQGDPSAGFVAEVLLCYAGMSAIIHHRLAHALHQLGAGLVARVISGIAHATTGIDIHPAARIGGSFFIDHGTGVVIGQTAIIGENVRLYQAVTLGAKRFTTDETGMLVKGEARHPIIEDNVVIYAGATVLGRIIVGHDSTIGGNVWLTQSVPPHSVVTQAQTRQTGAP